MKYNIQLLSNPFDNKAFVKHCGALVDGWVPIGLIDRDGDDPGAILIDSHGTYRQVNFKGEWARGLDTELVLEALATAIRIDNTKSFDSVKSQSIIMLDEISHQKLLEIGSGNLSRGIREAAVRVESMVTGEWENLGEVWSLKRFTVSIDDATRTILRRIGFGNMSAGARRAAKLASVTGGTVHEK